jgi:hypothetical protein
LRSLPVVRSVTSDSKNSSTCPARRWRLFLVLVSVNGLQVLYSSYLTQMLFTVKMKGKREGGCHLMLFVFALGPLIVEAR